MVLPALTLVIVVVTASVELVVTRVLEGVTVLVVTVDTDADDSTVLPWEFVGVKVDVVSTMTTDWELLLALCVMVDD
jgi:hypothetical protein